MPPPDRDRARRDEDHLLAARAAARDVVDQRVEPWRRISPLSSTSSAEPILTTSRRAAGERFGGLARSGRVASASCGVNDASSPHRGFSLAARLADTADSSAREHFRHAGAG